MLRKLLIFTGINLVIAALAASAPIALIGGADYARQRVVFDFIRDVPAGSSISVILGDSRSECCLAAKKLGFVNLSLAGATPVEAYYQLEKLLERGVSIDRLIVSFGPNHIFSQDTYYSRTRYFRFLDSVFIARVDDEIRELGDREYLEYGWRALEVIDNGLPFLSDDMKFSIVNILSIHTTLSSGLAGIADWINPPLAEVRLVADPRYKLYEITSTNQTNTGTVSPEYADPEARSPVNELYLQMLVDLARRHGIDTAYLAMPLNRDVQNPGDEYFERFDAVIRGAGLEKCYSGPRFWPDDFFFDPSHLNERGARKLNAELRFELNYCSW